MHRFYVEKNRIEKKGVIFEQDIEHQIRNVLRLIDSNKVIVFDNSGYEYLVELRNVNSKKIYGEIIEKTKKDSEALMKISLYQSVLKSKERFEYILQKCTELGISTFTPIICERSNFHQFNLNKLNRWKKIIREASEQSRRNITPKLFEPTSFSSAISKCSGLGMIAWENEENNRIKDVLKKWSTEKHLKNLSINIFIGPEGGFSSEEINQANQKEFESVSLGKHILRSETAGIVLSTSIFYEMDDL